MGRKLALFANLTLVAICVATNQAVSIDLTEDTQRPIRQMSLNEPYYNGFRLSAPYYNVPLPYYYQAPPTGGRFVVKEPNQGSPLLNDPFSINAPQPFGNRMSASYKPESSHHPASSRIPDPFETSCTSPTGEKGVCAPRSVCNTFGGRPSGSCSHGRACCINDVHLCGSSIILNNTYWNTPEETVSKCSVTVKVDAEYIGQAKPTCQIRLDFESFSIAQPNAQTVCSTDTFEVMGSTNKVPTVCGDNDGQHMYLHVPNSAIKPTDLKLTFKFTGVTASAQGKWKIRVTYLPCNSPYLAPDNCLQYFSSISGKFQSFNWKDTAETATRQLANQDYSICFKNEIINDKRASKMCYSVCTTQSNQAFSLSVANTDAGGLAATSVATAQSQNMQENCNNDFLIIPGGYDPSRDSNPKNARDRYCGEVFSTAYAEGTNANKICTTGRPFSVLYQTNGDEDTTATVDSTTRGNIGFCLSFSQEP